MIGVTQTGPWGRVQLTFEQLASKDFSALNRVLSEMLVSQTAERFQTMEAPDGRAWAPTSRGGSILRDKGILLASIHAGGESDRETAQAGTNVIYARIHQFGHDQKGIEARAFFGLSSQNLTDINDEVADFLDIEL